MPLLRLLVASFACTSALSVITLGNTYAQQTSQTDPPTKNVYPTEVVKTFMKGCQFKGDKVYCTCILDKLQFQYTFAEFTQLDNQIRETRKVPNEVQETFNSCNQFKK